MDQDPTPTPQPAGDARPGVFGKINGTIAGITGLVVAVGGLAATWDRIFPANQAEASAPAANEVETVPPDETAATPEDVAAPEASDPTRYTGQRVKGGKAISLEWNGDGWTLTEGDDTYSYDDVTSPDENKVMAVSNGNYLRWPIDGGEVDESEDKVSWKTYGSVNPVAEPAAE